jgi:predicted LPLAT superfamily acyltransferase
MCFRVSAPSLAHLSSPYAGTWLDRPELLVHVAQFLESLLADVATSQHLVQSNQFSAQVVELATRTMDGALLALLTYAPPQRPLTFATLRIAPLGVPTTHSTDPCEFCHATACPGGPLIPRRARGGRFRRGHTR